MMCWLTCVQFRKGDTNRTQIDMIETALSIIVKALLGWTRKTWILSYVDRDATTTTSTTTLTLLTIPLSPSDYHDDGDDDDDA